MSRETNRDIMNRKEKISTVRTYVLLRQALYSLLTETPFEKISLTDICSRSMVPRSTFYRYFEDKYDLLRYSLALFFEEAHLDRDTVFSTDIRSLRRFFDTLFTYFEKHREEYVRIYQLNRQGILIDTMRSFIMQIFLDKISEAEETGIHLTIPAPIFTRLLADFYVSAARCYLESNGEYTAARFSQSVIRFAEKEFFE